MSKKEEDRDEACCCWCGKPFVRPYRSTKYCCEYCRKEGTREKIRNRVRAYRKRYNQHTMGTSGIGKTCNKDVEIEGNIIKKEKRRLLLEEYWK